MKTQLPLQSKNHQRIIERIVQLIQEQGQTKIAYIILFGSFAKGDWADDFRQEKDGMWTSYNSDYDFLVLTKKHIDGEMARAINLERKITDRIEKEGLDKKRPASIIIESLNKVNNDLKKGHYFFSDIQKEGILLYKDEKAKELAQAKELNNQEKQEISQEYFDYWFKKSKAFHSASISELEKGENNISAFLLHQVTEALFSCIELVFTHYKPKTHNIEILNKKCLPFAKELKDIFLKNTKKEKECFELLKLAYIDARYDKNYIITKEQLEYLIIRVKKLKEITEKICQEKINSFN